MVGQTAATIFLIGLAAAIVVRRLNGLFSSRSVKPCGSCGGCSGKAPALTITPLVQLGAPSAVPPHFTAGAPASPSKDP